MPDLTIKDETRLTRVPSSYVGDVSNDLSAESYASADMNALRGFGYASVQLGLWSTGALVAATPTKFTDWSTHNASNVVMWGRGVTIDSANARFLVNKGRIVARVLAPTGSTVADLLTFQWRVNGAVVGASAGKGYCVISPPATAAPHLEGIALATAVLNHEITADSTPVELYITAQTGTPTLTGGSMFLDVQIIETPTA